MNTTTTNKIIDERFLLIQYQDLIKKNLLKKLCELLKKRLEIKEKNEFSKELRSFFNANYLLDIGLIFFMKSFLGKSQSKIKNCMDEFYGIHDIIRQNEIKIKQIDTEPDLIKDPDLIKRTSELFEIKITFLNTSMPNVISESPANFSDHYLLMHDGKGGFDWR